MSIRQSKLVNGGKSSKRERGLILLLFLVLLSACMCLVVSLLVQFLAGNQSWLPVHLHSTLEANYQPDDWAVYQAPIDNGLLKDLLIGIGTPGAYSTLEVILLTPVPSVTPLPGTVYPTWTPTLVTPSQTPTLLASSTATGTASATLSVTPTPTITPRSGQPTNTPRPSPTSGPANTSTSIPPTSITPATATTHPTWPPNPTSTNPPPPTATKDPYPYP